MRAADDTKQLGTFNPLRVMHPGLLSEGGSIGGGRGKGILACRLRTIIPSPCFLSRFINRQIRRRNRGQVITIFLTADYQYR